MHFEDEKWKLSQIEGAADGAALSIEMFLHALARLRALFAESEQADSVPKRAAALMTASHNRKHRKGCGDAKSNLA